MVNCYWNWICIHIFKSIWGLKSCYPSHDLSGEGVTSREFSWFQGDVFTLLEMVLAWVLHIDSVDCVVDCLGPIAFNGCTFLWWTTHPVVPFILHAFFHVSAYLMMMMAPCFTCATMIHFVDREFKVAQIPFWKIDKVWMLVGLRITAAYDGNESTDFVWKRGNLILVATMEFVTVDQHIHYGVLKKKMILSTMLK